MASMASGGFVALRSAALARGFRPAAAILVLIFGVLGVPSGAGAKPGPDGFADLAAKLSPAVVNVSTTQNVKSDKTARGPDLPQFPPGSPLDDLFKDFMDRNRGGSGG